MNGPREFTSSSKAWEYLRGKAAATKAQELREKLERDIQLIRERNKRTESGITPGPEPGPVLSDLRDQGQDQDGRFANLESNGMLMLLNLATATATTTASESGNDISNLYFACKTLLDNLEKRRVLQLLPQVFGVLRMNQYLEFIQEPKSVDDDDDDDDDDEDDDDDDDGTGHDDNDDKEEEQDHGNLDVLNLRLVSKSWKDAADAQFFAPVGFSEPDWHLRKDFSNLMIMSSPFKLKFEKMEDVESAMQALGANSSPLVRIVDVNMTQVDGDGDGDDDVRVKGFVAKLLRFLDLYGEHVWALHLTGRFDYDTIRKMVSRMPNLKELFLNSLEDWAETDEMAMSEEDEKLKVVKLPFPTLPSLKRIVFDSIPEYKILTREILAKNPSLKTVSIAEDDPCELQDLYPTLANLQLECFDLNFGDDMHSLFPEILPLAQMNWPLRVLNISLAEDTYDVIMVNAAKLFGIINQFNETLEEIDLEAVLLNDYDGVSWVVHFPKLKVINKVWGFCSI